MGRVRIVHPMTGESRDIDELAIPFFPDFVLATPGMPAPKSAAQIARTVAEQKAKTEQATTEQVEADSEPVEQPAKQAQKAPKTTQDKE